MGWRKQLYDTNRWRKRSRYQLDHFPMCQACVAAGRKYVQAQVVHHLTEHYPGAPDLAFHLSKIVSLCRDCHEALHQRQARRPYRTDIGPDGFPVDESNHPFWQASKRQEEREDRDDKTAGGTKNPEGGTLLLTVRPKLAVSSAY